MCVAYRIWGALKDAVDGAFHFPYTTENFLGFRPPYEKGQDGDYGTEAHKDQIFGNHDKEYMEMPQKENPIKYEAHLFKPIADGIDAGKMEGMYTDEHENIREDPTDERSVAVFVTF